MTRTAKLLAPAVLAAGLVLAPATAQAAPERTEPHVTVCPPGMHLTGATCFVNHQPPHDGNWWTLPALGAFYLIFAW